jgi:hypothetical protein
VLEAEGGDEEEIDEDAEGWGKGGSCFSVDGIRDGEVVDEANQIEEGDEKDAVANEGVEEEDGFFHDEVD